MGQQVISVNAFGAISGMQHKPGQGVDLRTFGLASITRASEVLWDAGRQAWFVEFRDGSGDVLAGVRLTTYMATFRVGEPTPLPPTEDGMTLKDVPVAYFAEYDDAVKAEINYLNWARSQGLLPT